LPTVTTLTTSLGEVETVVEIGDSAIQLTFNQAVRVVLSGMTGKRALWANSAGSYDISSCDSTATSADEGTLVSGECYLDDGNDLIIWTFHFTTFGAYTPTAVDEEDTEEDHYRRIGGGGSFLEDDTSPIADFSSPLDENTNSNPTGGLGITGGVIGALTSPLSLLAIGIIFALGLILIVLSKKKKREELERKKKIQHQLKTVEEDVKDAALKVEENSLIGNEKDKKSKKKKSKKSRRKKKK